MLLLLSLILWHRFSHGPTPAQIELSEHRDELLGGPNVHAVMPPARMVDSVVTDMPVLVNKGGALEAPDGGETVVRVSGSSETRMVLQADEPSVEGVVRSLERTHVAHKPDNVIIQQAS